MIRLSFLVILLTLTVLSPGTALAQRVAADVYLSLRTGQGDRWLGFGPNGEITLGAPNQAAVFVMVPQSDGDGYFRIRGTQGDPWLIPMDGTVKSGDYRTAPSSLHFVKNMSRAGAPVSVGDQVSLRGTVGDPWWWAKGDSNLLLSGVPELQATVFVIETSLKPAVLVAQTIAGPKYQADYSLNKESQIALACVSKFGATKAAVACMAGTLTTAEMEKCRTKGIGGDGCFGNSNTLVKIFTDNWDAARRESNPIAALTRLGTGVSVTDIQKHGILGGCNSDARKVFGMGCSTYRALGVLGILDAPVVSDDA